MIDLTKFCGSDADPRAHLRAPWRCADGIGATNGHILICVADDGGQHPDVIKDVAATTRRFKTALDDAGRQWFDATSIAMPDAVACMHCDGKGHTFHEECEDCDGEGEFQHGSHWYECKECGGNGKVPATEGAGKKETCYRCNGTGEGFKPVKVGAAPLQRMYLALIVGLPGCRIGVLDNHSVVTFTFDGGFGALMPCLE